MKSVFSLILLLLCGAADAISIECHEQAPSINKIRGYFEQISALSDQQSQDALVENDLPFVDTRRTFYEIILKQCLIGLKHREKLAQMSDEQLSGFFFILWQVNFFTHDIDSATLLSRVFSLLDSRGRPVEHFIAKLYGSFVRSRLFDKARLLARRYPETVLPLLPDIQNLHTNGKRLLSYEDNQLVTQSFDYPVGGHIIIVSSPICNPCRRFFNWLKSEPEIMQRLTTNATWIMPVDGDFYLDELLSVNQQYAPIRLQYVYSLDDWPQITDWSTPNLYFIYNGKVVKQLTGWPQNGRKAGLMRGLKAIGL